MARELLSTLGPYLVDGSLSDVHVLAQTGLESPLPILPKANVIQDRRAEFHRSWSRGGLSLD
jgi:hypothetical protein